MATLYPHRYADYGDSDATTIQWATGTTAADYHTHNHVLDCPTGTATTCVTNRIYVDDSYGIMNSINGDILLDGGRQKLICKGDIKLEGNVDINLNVRSMSISPNDMQRHLILETEAILDKEKSTRRKSTCVIPLALQEMLLHREALGEVFKQAVKQSAEMHGRKIAQDLIAGKISRADEDMTSLRQARDKILNEFEIEIPTKDGVCSVPLRSILNERTEGEKFTFNYELVRLERKKHENKMFIRKAKSVNIIRHITTARIKLEDAYNFWNIKNKDFSNMPEEQMQKDLKALTLLRRLVQQDEFKKYMTEKYIDVPDIQDKNKVYRIHRDNQIEVLVGDRIQERLCIHLKENIVSRRSINEAVEEVNYANYPKTDEVIARLMLAKNNPKELVNRSNVYKNNNLTTANCDRIDVTVRCLDNVAV